MNTTEQGIAQYLGQDRLAFVQSVRIGIAGAGGLGSNAAMHLVRSGFKRFVIADFDQVEPSNLNRQFYFPGQVGLPKVEALAENLRAINPDLELELHPIRLDRDSMARLFRGCHALVEALDDPAAKKTLVETLLPSGVFLAAASGMGGHGRAGSITTRRMGDKCCIVGDMETECTAEAPPLAPMVGVCAAMQADAVLHHVLNAYEEKNT